MSQHDLWALDPSYEPFAGERDLTHRDADWSGLRVVVAGLGVSGFAAAERALKLGAGEEVKDLLARLRETLPR